jgi:hypothetical protein
MRVAGARGTQGQAAAQPAAAAAPLETVVAALQAVASGLEHLLAHLAPTQAGGPLAAPPLPGPLPHLMPALSYAMPSLVLPTTPPIGLPSGTEMVATSLTGGLAHFPAATAPAPLAAVAATASAPLAAIAAAAATPSSDALGTRLSPVDKPLPFSSMETLPWKVQTEMDPRLQLAVANSRAGKPSLALSSTAGGEVAVIARVRSLEEWEALPDVVTGSTVGKAGEDTWIVTGRVPVERAETVHKAPTVVSLKAAQPIHPALSKTLPAMAAAPPFSAGVNPDGGNGVIVGIVDFGCDFAHRNFRNADGSSRILAIWNQGAPALSTSPFGYGRKYVKAEIDAALRALNPYVTLGYGPPQDPDGTHGTHVMDIAAGNGLGSHQPGLAPKADIVFVEVSASDIAWQGPDTVKQAFGDSVHCSRRCVSFSTSLVISRASATLVSAPTAALTTAAHWLSKGSTR